MVQRRSARGSSSEVEYAVRSHSTGGTSALERECKYMAADGWRLVSAAATSVGISIHVFLFFERPTGSDPSAST